MEITVKQLKEALNKITNDNEKIYIEAGCEYWDDCITCEYECFVKKILDIINKPYKR